MSNEQQTVASSTQHAEAAEDDRRHDRPDRRAPRGNQEVEQLDVERGEEKIDRVLGW